MLALMPVVNHRLLRAGASGVERTEAIYDLAGIAVRSGAADTPFASAQVLTLEMRGCVRPFFWDPLGDPSRCGGSTAPLTEWPPGLLYEAMASAAVRHPIAYAAHRLAHLNSTERWLVPWNWPDAAPPVVSERNTLGLGSPGPVAHWWDEAAAGLVLTPLAWPVVMVVAGVFALGAMGRRTLAPAVELAQALLVSAVLLEASFAVLSIASDLRYHLWPMLAVALGWVLLWPELPRRRVRAAAIALTLVVGVTVVARVALPAAPTTYRAMLG